MVATLKLPADILELEAEDESINVLVHGESGCGKTPFAASAAKGLLLATEKGTVSAQRRGSTAKIWKCDTWAKFQKAKLWLTKAGEHPGGIPFTWVSVDSGTQLQTLHLRHILETEFKSAPSKRDLDIPQLQDHQKWQNEFKRNVQELVDLPVNLCMTALPMSIESEDVEGNIEEWILPQFLGKKGAIAWTCTGQFSAGGRIRLVKNKAGKLVQRINWTKSGNHWGRDRYNALGSFTDNLTLDDLAIRVAESARKAA